MAIYRCPQVSWTVVRPRFFKVSPKFKRSDGGVVVVAFRFPARHPRVPGSSHPGCAQVLKFVPDDRSDVETSTNKLIYDKTNQDEGHYKKPPQFLLHKQPEEPDECIIGREHPQDTHADVEV